MLRDIERLSGLCRRCRRRGLIISVPLRGLVHFRPVLGILFLHQSQMLNLVFHFLRDGCPFPAVKRDAHVPPEAVDLLPRRDIPVAAYSKDILPGLLFRHPEKLLDLCRALENSMWVAVPPVILLKVTFQFGGVFPQCLHSIYCLLDDRF